MSSADLSSETHPSVRAYEGILTRMRKALKEADRSEDAAFLTAVSKNQDWAVIAPLLDHGHRIFGENRVQEAQTRWGPVKESFPDLQLRLIGPLQSNKTKEAIALFDVIESLDREKILDTVAEEMAKQGRQLKLYVQINIGEEEQKSGVLPQEADDFLKRARETYGLNISGLMCIPPVTRPSGPYFALLSKIAHRNGISDCSMGMSDDFETALKFGSTEIRVGSAIFGAR